MDRPGIEPELSGCKPEVLTVITISPFFLYNHYTIFKNFCKVQWFGLEPNTTNQGNDGIEPSFGRLRQFPFYLHYTLQIGRGGVEPPTTCVSDKHSYH